MFDLKKGDSISVLLNGKKLGERVSVSVDVVKANPFSVWVRLPDGNIIKRRARRDLPWLLEEAAQDA